MAPNHFGNLRIYGSLIQLAPRPTFFTFSPFPNEKLEASYQQ
uniref:Uncharacterized protein n=1 Tax=Manihot esculenta TaxID=3983 RepID=A0A2C9UXX3_MANES